MQSTYSINAGDRRPAVRALTQRSCTQVKIKATYHIEGCTGSDKALQSQCCARNVPEGATQWLADGQKHAVVWLCCAALADSCRQRCPQACVAENKNEVLELYPI